LTMVLTEDIGEYRGCSLIMYIQEPLLYGSPCTQYLRFTVDRVKADIDAMFAPPPPPPPPEPEDYIEETYRGVDIWWKVALEMYWAQVAVGYVALWATLPEMRASIDEILAFLEPPEDPEEGLFAQVVAELKNWFMVNIQPWVEQWGQVVNNWITNVTEYVTNVYNTVNEYVTNVVNNITEAITNVYNDLREYVTNVYNTTREYITNVYNTINEYVSNVTNVFNEYVTNNLYETTQYITNVIGVLDPQGVLKDPQGYIGGVFNLLIAPFTHGIIKSFWEGFEEGLEE